MAIRIAIAGRPQASCEADPLVATRVDRRPRSVDDLRDIVPQTKAKGVALNMTEQPIGTCTAAGRAFLDLLGLLAAAETDLRRER